MRVLIINTSERIGGAAVASNRLMAALNKHGIKAKMLVRDKQSEDICVVGLNRTLFNRWCFFWERLVIWVNNYFSKTNLFAVDIANVGCDITTLREFKEADVIHLNWINQGFLSVNGLKKILLSGKPVVWTMHDMWPITGVCHHSRHCNYYQSECKDCFYLKHIYRKKDLSTTLFYRKKKLYSLANLTFVGCSEWLTKKATKSALLNPSNQVVNIPNPINNSLFAPSDKVASRQLFNLPQDKKYILFGSVKITDKRKGFDYLIKAAHRMLEQDKSLKDKVGIILLGARSEFLQQAFPFEVYDFPYVSNVHELVSIYNCADLFVTPSLEENLPNMIMEAMSCAVPCVGFNVGGIPEMIDHQKNGYVAEYKSVDDLAKGMCWVLNSSNYSQLSSEAKHKVAHQYSEAVVVNQYIKLYHKLLNNHD